MAPTTQAHGERPAPPKTPQGRNRSELPTPPETPGRVLKRDSARKKASKLDRAARLLELIAWSLIPDARPDAPSNQTPPSSTSLLPPVSLVVKQEPLDDAQNVVISISSDDDGAKEELKPGDKPYHGRSSRSHVVANKEPPASAPIRTRAFWRRQGNQSSDVHEDADQSKTRKSYSRRKVKSAQIVISTDEEGTERPAKKSKLADQDMAPQPDTSRELSPVSKRMREMNEELRYKSTLGLSESDPDAVPEASVVLGRKVIPVQPLPSFIKDEADESNGDDDGESNGEYESNGDVEEMSVDDYDRDDPFIDDRSVFSYEEEIQNGSNDEEDSAPSDEDIQLELTKVQSMITKLRDNISKEDYKSTMDIVAHSIKKATTTAANKAKKKAMGKGKEKARSISPVEDDEFANLSDNERDQLLLAIANSKNENRQGILSNTTGGPSFDPSGSASTSSSFTPVFTIPTPMVASHPPMPTTPVGTISGASGTVGSTPVNTGAAATPTYVVANPPTTPVSAPLFSVNGPTTPIAPAAGAGLTFAALIAQTPGAATHAGSFSADSIFVQHCTSLSAINEVHNPLLFDPILAQDYPTLCNLRAGVIEGWSKNRGRGHPWFCDWGRLCPNMHARIALSAIRFKESTKYINPSHAVPTSVHLRETSHQPPRYQLMRNRSVLYVMSCGKVMKCSLFTPGTNGMQQKFITFSMHKQEWERWCGWVCSVFGQERMDAQYAMSSLQVTTRSDTNKPDAGSDQPRTLLTDAFVIDTDDNVPVYDARAAGATFNFDTDVDHVDSILPRWTEGEVPVGSCVVVAYSMVSYFSGKKKWSLGCNVRWVIVLGVKDPSVDDN